MDRASQNVKRFRLVMIGNTGAGKSASANSILGREAFHSKESSSSVTRKCEKATANRPGYEFEIIDTPGFLDTNLSQDEVSKEIKECVKMCLPGPHAFILVMRIGRFTEKDLQTIEYFKATFGEGMLKYLFVLFTGMDALERERRKITEFIEEAPNDLKDFLRTIGDRYFGINNIEDDRKKKTEQVEKILKAVDLNLSKHGVAYYTSEMLQKAEEEERRQKEEENRKEQELMKQKMKELMQQNQRENLDISVRAQIQIGVEGFNVGEWLSNAASRFISNLFENGRANRHFQDQIQEELYSQVGISPHVFLENGQRELRQRCMGNLDQGLLRLEMQEMIRKSGLGN